ncbi:MAG: YbaK/EbsC family protein [Acidimicrobiaceae bacterium]|nr:YbaK/EbsC family protein [Acidimicrobiaceae bacterium]MDG1086911.1 YbaK/EbsC family protein [Acidimicrobiales bacterium]
MAQAPAVERFVAAATKLGIQPEVNTFPKDTRTAQQAAEALGCELGQIVKSLIFKAGDELVLVLTSGVNRVDETKAATLFDVDKLGKANADEARIATGFAIGGIPPCGHPTPLRSVIDTDLLTWQTVWAAAGAPDAVFEITPERLVEITGATPSAVS